MKVEKTDRADGVRIEISGLGGAVRVLQPDAARRLADQIYLALDEPPEGSIIVEVNRAVDSLYYATARFEKSLLDAVEVIRAWHGDLGWSIYSVHAPEMKTINAAIVACRAIMRRIKP